MSKILCPWCGAEMEWNRSYYSQLMPGTRVSFWYECECGARSPMRETSEAAHAAAMQRWQKPNRVLALEEIIALDGDCVVWHEWRNGAVQRFFRDEISTEDEPMARKNYGTIARYWARRPTDEERENTPWA